MFILFDTRMRSVYKTNETKGAACIPEKEGRMRVYRIAGVLIIVLIVAAIYTLVAHQQQKATRYFQTTRSKNIVEDVEQAKQKGLSEIHIPIPKVTGPEANDIDTMLLSDSVVVARLIDKESAFYDDTKSVIVTWLRFEPSTHIAGPAIPNLPLPSNAPDRLTRIAAQASFLVRVYGGTIHEAGVKVVSDSPLAELPVGSNFVLFVFFDRDATEAFGGLNYGPQSVIRIDEAGKVHVSSAVPNEVVSRFITEKQISDVTSLTLTLRERAKALGR